MRLWWWTAVLYLCFIYGAMVWVYLGNWWLTSVYFIDRPKAIAWLRNRCVHCVYISGATGLHDCILCFHWSANPFPTQETRQVTNRVKCPTWDWIGLCSVLQYRLYGRWFLQVKRPNQQYQSTEGKSTKDKSNNGNNTKQTCMDNNRDE